MRIVLEATDLLEILGLHLGRALTPDQVHVRTEPHLEIEIDGAVAVQDLNKPEARQMPVTSPPDSGYAARRERVAEDDGLSMREIMEYSRQIEEGIRANGR